MTKERKLEILKDLLVQLSDSANILCTCEADERCDVIEEYIKALEQQPNEYCVDINHVIATISQHHFDKDKDNFDLLIHNLCKEVKELPPVTPTHDTCKDCKYLLKDISSFCCRINYRRVTNQNFYCGNYEKREGEVVEMTREIWEERKNLPIDGKTDF